MAVCPPSELRTHARFWPQRHRRLPHSVNSALLCILSSIDRPPSSPYTPWCYRNRCRPPECTAIVEMPLCRSFSPSPCHPAVSVRSRSHHLAWQIGRAPLILVLPHAIGTGWPGHLGWLARPSTPPQLALSPGPAS
jgi:hypothetical protein